MSFRDDLFKIGRKASRFLRTKGPAICTGVGCVCVVGCGIIAWFERPKADKIISELPEDATVIDKVKATWKQWTPPVAIGAIGVGAIIFGNGLSRRQITLLTCSNATLSAALFDFKKAVRDRYGENTYYDILRSEADKELSGTVMISGEEEDWQQYDRELDIITLDPKGALYYQADDKIWFRQTPLKVLSAYTKINSDMQREGCALKEDYYWYLGFPNEMIPETWKYSGWDYNDVVDHVGVAWIEMLEKTGKEAHRYPFMGFVTPSGVSCEEYTVLEFVSMPDTIVE